MCFAKYLLLYTLIRLLSLTDQTEGEGGRENKAPQYFFFFCYLLYLRHSMQWLVVRVSNLCRTQEKVSKKCGNEAFGWNGRAYPEKP